MKTSDQINEIATSLAKAQGEMAPADKDSLNPHFKNKYASLASVIASVQPALSKNGLSFIQTLFEGRLATRLLHSSGQWIESEMTLSPSQNTMQALGSAISYARRYSLQAILGNASADDDGNQASDDGNQASIERDPSCAPPSENIPSIRSGRSHTQTPHNMPPCSACKGDLSLAKSGKGYYCSNFKDAVERGGKMVHGKSGKEHVYVPLDRAEEYRRACEGQYQANIELIPLPSDDDHPPALT